MKCKYIYQSKEGTFHQFNNEIELDDFLLSRHKFEDQFGDLVFSKDIETAGYVARAKAEEIAKKTKELKKKLQNIDYVDEEEIENYIKPYIGVTKYLNQFVDDLGHPLFPIFTPKEYWDRRFKYWGDTTQDINKEYNVTTGTGVYTKEEKELIFGNDPPRRLSGDEMETWRKIIEQKWKQQGLLGEDIHHCLEMFFKKHYGVYNFIKFENDRQGFIDMIKKYTENGDKLDNTVVGEVIDYGYKLLKEIQRVIPDSKNLKGLDFYPELKISGRLNEARGDGVEYLVGSIDLLVVDGKGNSYIFDYKTSPKTYSNYNDAKIRTFMYQFAVYNRLLQRFGFNDSSNKQFVFPIVFENYRLVNRDEAIQNPEKAVFTYDHITYDQTGISKDLTNSIKSDDSLNAHLDSFLPPIKLTDVDTEKLIERVTEDMDKLFGGQFQRKSYTNEDIEKLLKDVKPNEKNIWSYELRGGYSTTPITAKSKPELFAKVKDLYQKFETADTRRVDIIRNAIETARQQGIDTIDEVLNKISTKRLFDETGKLDYLKTVLKPYFENESWVAVKDDGAAQFGCLILKNEHTKQIDVIKVSGKNLDRKVVHETTSSSGKVIKNPRRSNITYNFETDIEEKQNKNSGILPGTIGNIESMEALLILNQKKSLFEGGFKIGNIQVVNPFTGQGSKAPNWQLEYSYKKLRKHQAIYEGIDNINDGSIKFMDLLDIVESDFQIELNKENVNEGFGGDTKEFRSALTVLDSAQDNQSKLDAVEKLIEMVRKKYPQDTVQLQNNSGSKGARLYNRLLLAAAELRGIKFKQQIEKTDKYPIYNLKKALKQGLSSSYIDNPGNLDSETLNLLTQLVTEGYQNIRNEMTNYIPKVREVTEKLKKSKSFGWLAQNTFGNETSIFQSLIQDRDDDLVMKKISDLNTKEEKEFAKYFLRTVNRNRFPGRSELELDEMEKNGDIEYYRIPLAKGSFSSEVAMNGLFKSLVGRLAKWTPANALKELREKAEGLFTDEEVEQIDNSNSQLFEMNNRFARCDTDEEYRLDIITKKGKEYFEQNLETILLEHIFAYTTKKHLDNIFPMIRAAMVHLKVMGENEQNRQFTPDLEYAEDYIKATIKNQPIDKNLQQMEMKAFTGKLKQAASYCALAFSPVQAIYQTIQGLWVDISLMIRQPDGTKAFTFSNFSKAFKIVYADLFPNGDKPTKVQLLNELYGVNDMDMNNYIKNIKSDKGGFFNMYDIAFKFTSRPDYYNRMTILVAQMIHDGTWDAYEVKDGKLVYNDKLDKRFEHFRNNDTSDKAKYDFEKSLYFAIAEQHIKEGAVYPDGKEFKLNGDKYVPLPAAHTIQEIESFKALGDLIYGYYSHEKKSLIHYTFIGALFMQMRTYWSGKKNQYLAPGGVKVQGKWEHIKNEKGELMYHQVIDGKIRTDLEPVTTNTGAPVVQWKGIWQEGIMVTLSTLAQGMYDYMKSHDSYDIFEAYRDAVKSKYKNSEELERAFHANMNQLWYDLTVAFFIGSVVSGMLLGNWAKELTKRAKEEEDIISGLQASAVNILVMSLRNSAADFNFWNSIMNPAVQWTPFAFETGGRIFKNVWNTAFGDRTFWGGVTNTFAVTKQFKPLMQNVAPLYEPKE